VHLLLLGEFGWQGAVRLSRSYGVIAKAQHGVRWDWKRLHQGTRRWVAGAANFACGQALNDRSMIEDRDAVAKPHDGDEVVGNIEQTGPVPAIQVAEQIDNLHLGDGIKRAGRLIRDDERGPMQKGQSNQHTLCLAYADLRGTTTEKGIVSWELYFCHELSDSLEHRSSPAFLVSPPGFAEMALQAERGIEGGHRALRNQSYRAPADPAQVFLREREQVPSRHEHLSAHAAAAPGKQANQRKNEGALPRSAGANEAQDLTRLKFEGEIAEHNAAGILSGKPDAEKRLTVHRGLAV
jgi:hypothetical protein